MRKQDSRGKPRSITIAEVIALVQLAKMIFEMFAKKTKSEKRREACEAIVEALNGWK